MIIQTAKRENEMPATAAKLKMVSEPTDGGNEGIAFSEPYHMQVTIQGATDIILHAYNPEAVEEKGNASKNSKSKKTDNVESYVNRNEEGYISLPGSYVRGALINAARFQQDPRSPRKSAMDLFKAGAIVMTELASFGVKEWDYLDKRRVVVQRSAITRVRPALHKGWTATVNIMVLLPEYIDQQRLRDTIDAAGRLVGVGDFRPTYGRFGIIDYRPIAQE
jgi:hypothetical protein